MEFFLHSPGQEMKREVRIGKAETKQDSKKKRSFEISKKNAIIRILFGLGD